MFSWPLVARRVRQRRRQQGLIPIVVAYISDPVRVGLAESYARPGGNLTAVANFAFDVTPKQLELLKEAYPRASRVAVLGLREGPGHVWTWDKMLESSAKVGVALYRATIGGRTDYEAAFTAIREQRADAVIVEPDPVN
jgi:ABC-type uncharacterized transport system substrate-binding protein